jgi:hypothetical protein
MKYVAQLTIGASKLAIILQEGLLRGHKEGIHMLKDPKPP